MFVVLGTVIILVGTCLGIYWLHQSSTSDHVGTVFINGTAPVASTDDDFICVTLDWWPPEKCDYGTCSWGRTSLLTLDLSSTLLSNAVKAFAPLKIRMGGTLQDKVVYGPQGDQTPFPVFTKNSSNFLGFSNACLLMSRWDELNTFFKQTGSVVTFGLNALYGRRIGSDGSVHGAWNSSNAEYLIRYTENHGYSIHGWELGNELSGNGVGGRVSAHQYAADIKVLHRIVQDAYKVFDLKPLVLAPGGFFNAKWFGDFVEQAGKNAEVVTHHIYNLGPGVDQRLTDKILNPTYLDGGLQTFIDLDDILKKSGTSAVAWVGEAGGAYNSGRDLVSNAFVFSFWYLDQLGMSATYSTKTYCRQTLIGGNYGLLDKDTFLPNPDYYSALLWHRLMGKTVLSTKFSGSKSIRAYSHCSKNSQGITLLLINLDGNSAIQIRISITGNTTLPLHDNPSQTTREEYHLTAKDGDLHSKVMLLNGEELKSSACRGGAVLEEDSKCKDSFVSGGAAENCTDAVATATAAAEGMGCRDGFEVKQWGAFHSTRYRRHSFRGLKVVDFMVKTTRKKK